MNIIKKFLLNEITKCNNFRYEVPIGNLHIRIKTRKCYLSLIKHSYYFEGKFNYKIIFDGYNDLLYSNIWLYKFPYYLVEKQTKLKYDEITLVINNILKKILNTKIINIRLMTYEYVYLKND